MGNKYYVPDIEEFHVGFEYEVSNALIRGLSAVKPPEEWYKYKFINTKPYDLEFIQYNIDHNLGMIRVKFLDRKDIESLGFKNIDLKQSLGHHFILGENRIWLNGIFVYIYKGIEICFRGTIKNKSELKVLLKQLNIL